ncbi:PilZ domain-containing protein [Aestuariirhabdus litorea]|uniref:PilZ domain-containing protein n=1 Tax=Aestuariirhabdus litorea TaxID=2528527 RepID=A0A3P3VQR6_9GAMM|nr:PilZ domain-containing protein [Aestuariirhabdus litorea]RRJ85075.1 PilZ domain-containing protein [Aestuariirhabdus litorea]RWW98300.1 PilZ domain-containing protein [Endozoicomonadaceae bacterium GTF-13]
MANEQRRGNRVPRVERVLVQMAASSYDHLLSGETVSARTRDISQQGFRAILDQEVAVGTVLQICISVTDHQRRYLLSAEVCWCSPSDGGSTCAGFRILPSEDSDYEGWMNAFSGIDQGRARRSH